MSYYREESDRNPGFPPKSPPPPQFREYSLWGSSYTFNMHDPAPQAPRRHFYPTTRVADDGPRPYYHSADHPKSSRIQRVDRLAWAPFLPDHEEQRTCIQRVDRLAWAPLMSDHEEHRSHIQRVDRLAWSSFMPDHEEQRSMTLQSPVEYTRSEEEPKPVVTGTLLPELQAATEVVEIERKSLFIDPDNFGDEIDDPSPEPQEQASTSSGSSGEWTSNIFNREGAPSSQSHILPPKIQHGGRRTNTLNKRLVKALSQPVKMEKGAKMMQRMGWIGGGLGKDGSGIVDPIAPNAIYATTTIGFGQEIQSQCLPTKRQNFCVKPKKNKKMRQHAFKINVLLSLRKFATNDMQVELHFEPLLSSTERKRIHHIVEAIGNKDSNMQFGEYLRIVEDIRKQCRFTLSTQSDGVGQQRKICVFKDAPDNMYLVTPNDCRPCITDLALCNEEANPFLRSINKHIKEDPETESPAPSYLIDKLVEFFLEFCVGEAYTEFRFLGPFTTKEIHVINAFFALIDDLCKKLKPDFKVPLELLDVFAGDFEFRTVKDPKGFISISKFSRKDEHKKFH